MSLATGTLTTPVGDGLSVFGGDPGDGGPATAAQLVFPADVNTDPAGNLIVADRQDGLIRVAAAKTGTFYGVAMTKGDIYAVAGDGATGTPTSGAPALSTPLFPESVAADSHGNLFIGTGQIWMVPAASGTHFGQSMTAGDIYLLQGHGRRHGPGGSARERGRRRWRGRPGRRGGQRHLLRPEDDRRPRLRGGRRRQQARRRRPGHQGPAWTTWSACRSTSPAT